MRKLFNQIQTRISNISQFLQKDIWRIRLKELPKGKAILINNLRMLLIVFQGIGRGKLDIRASALTFYTLLSLIPVLAILFGITRGFGIERNLEQVLYDNFSLQDDIIDKIILFSNTILEKTKGGVLASVAIPVLIWSIIKVLTTIERTFNDIWQIKKSRALGRKISDYLLIIIIAPALMIFGSSATVFLASTVRTLAIESTIIGYISPFLHFSLKLAPYLTIWILLTFMYKIVPNTKVEFKAAVVAAIIAGTLYQIVQIIYIRFQLGVTSYNALYGSFAALPLFLIWVQLSWTIVLLGAEISFANQHVNRYDFESDSLYISNAMKRTLNLLVAHTVIRNFANGKPPLTADEISEKLDLPTRLTNKLLNELTDSKIFTETYTKEYKERGYQPAIDINKIRVNDVLRTLDQLGNDDIQIGESLTRSKILDILADFRESLHENSSNMLIKDI